MARRRTAPKDLPDAVRDAVERTVQATVGSAERSRDRAQDALDDLVGRVRPASQDDIRELKAELRRIGRRLDAIEERLPATRKRKTGGGGRSRTRSS
jgi:hypothetical protein